MEIEGWITKKEKEVVDVICDRCGKSTKVKIASGARAVDHEHETLGPPEDIFNTVYGEFKAHWGYGSQADGIIEVAHLCEKCWKKARKALEKIGVKIQTRHQ